MTSIFDQYDKTLKRNDMGSTIANAIPTSSGYVSVRMKDEIPIFVRRKMNLNLPHELTHVVVSSGWIFVLFTNKVLFRMDLTNIDRYDEVPLEKLTAGLNISSIFLDPLGVHLLIALAPKSPGIASELLYLHRRHTKPKKIDKFRDHEITAVAFNYENESETSTGSILLGTSKGLIFESEFGIEAEKVTHNNWKQLPNYLPLYGNKDIDGLVFDIRRNENIPVTGIECFRIPNTNKYVILATSLDRFYKFQETLRADDKQPLQSIFNSYLNVPEHIKDFHEIPNPKKLTRTKLYICYDHQNHFSHSFGWLTEPGIFYGEMDPKADTPGHIVSNEIIPYPEIIDSQGVKKTPVPLSFVLTDFHAVLIYSDHITAVSLLNYRTVYEEYFNESMGPLLNVVRDSKEKMIYVYSNKQIFRIKVTNEQRNAWHIYLEKGEFENAVKYSRDNPAHMDIVLVKQAEICFKLRDFKESARIYSQTQSSFEGVCLKFLEINENDALMIFLQAKLEGMKAQEKTQITMLVVWMVELFLTEMARNADLPQQVKRLQADLDRFMKLPKVIECMKSNRSVIYELMASHGDNHNLTTLITVNKDFESVINQHINQSKFKDALAVLKNQNKAELFYKYAPILMEDIPKETISGIIGQGKRLDPIKLLPTMICIESDAHVIEVIKYLEFCIHSSGCIEQAIHNFLIKLYGKYKKDKLMTYLETQGKDISMINYDVHYALRVCKQHDVPEACVFLQCLLELWHPAVELALTFNTKLAQQTASQPQDRDLRRKLWLRIAEHEIKGKDDVKEALDLLKECDLLRIEDLLPFFSDFQKIDHFKEAICDALKEYNSKIQEQRKDMDESAKSAEKVRSELLSFRNRSVTIAATEQCSICGIYLLLKPFFIFPCGHKFHGDCLEKQIIPMLSIEKSLKLSALKQKLTTMSTQPNDTISVQGTTISTRDIVKGEIENILASDCLFCGEYMINTIDQPFIDDWERVKSDWQ